MSPDAAVAAYRQLVETVLERLADEDGVELRFTPPDAKAEVRPWLKDTWLAIPQGEGDLGQRLDDAFGDAFRSGAARVVIIGSDCPYLNADDIRTAWDKLHECDLVIGPARDGGYWLIGLRAPHPKLFENISWSSEKVLAETIARARSLGLTTHPLRTLSDVDTAEDWKEFISAAIPGPTPRRSPGAG